MPRLRKHFRNWSQNIMGLPARQAFLLEATIRILSTFLGIRRCVEHRLQHLVAFIIGGLFHV